MKKTIPIVLILALTVAATLIMINPVLAQSPAPANSVPAPAVPQFTLNSCDNQTIVVTIKNQPLNPSFGVFYNIRTKDHSGSDWTNMFPSDCYFSQSNSANTLINYIGNHSAGNLIDFQIEAVVQNWTEVYVDDLVPGLPAAFQSDNFGHYPAWVPVASSGWSNTQTIAIPQSASASTLTPPANIPNTDILPKPDPWTPVIALVAVYLAVAVSPYLLLHRMHRKTHVKIKKPKL
jgi:hypothetical protein